MASYDPLLAKASSLLHSSTILHHLSFHCFVPLSGDWNQVRVPVFQRRRWSRSSRCVIVLQLVPSFKVRSPDAPFCLSESSFFSFNLSKKYSCSCLVFICFLSKDSIQQTIISLFSFGLGPNIRLEFFTFVDVLSANGFPYHRLHISTRRPAKFMNHFITFGVPCRAWAILSL